MHYTYFLNIKCKDNFQNGQMVKFYLWLKKQNKTNMDFFVSFFFTFYKQCRKPFFIELTENIFWW